MNEKTKLSGSRTFSSPPHNLPASPLSSFLIWHMPTHHLYDKNAMLALHTPQLTPEVGKGTKEMHL
jgi:hypothetical protein